MWWRIILFVFRRRSLVAFRGRKGLCFVVTVGINCRKMLSFSELFNGHKPDDMIHGRDGAYTHESFEAPESDNMQYTYLDYQHIKKIKSSSSRNAIELKGIFGGNVCFPPQYYDFIYAFLSARI